MTDDFVDLLRALSEAEARFLVVGAYALAIHGYPRATGDRDVWVEPTPENADRVFRGLQKFGAPLADVTPGDSHGRTWSIRSVCRRAASTC